MVPIVWIRTADCRVAKHCCADVAKTTAHKIKECQAISKNVLYFFNFLKHYNFKLEARFR